MDPQNPFTNSKKGKPSESGYQTFLKENAETVHSDHPNLNNISTIQLLNAKYNQLSSQDQQILASKAASQSQIQTIQNKKKKPLNKSGDGSPSSTPYISQNSATNYSQQESQHFPSLNSIKINQYNQQNSHPQISNNQRQYANSNYQTMSSIQSIQPKQNQIQQVTPKKHITKPIKKKQESEYSESDDESDSTYISSNQSRRIKIPSIAQKQSQSQSQSQILPQNYYFNQPQIKQNYSAQQQPQQKKPAVLPTPYQQSQSIPTQDHRIQYDQNESKRYINVNLNAKSCQVPLCNDPYYALQLNQMNSQRQQDPKFYHDIEVMLEDESSDPAREEGMTRRLVNEFELKSNFYFSMTPFDCNCLGNYPTSFNGK